MDRGELVPDSLIMGIMKIRLQEEDCKKGFILDGFPRTIPQAVELEKILETLGIKLDFVVNLEVPREVILDRLTTRRTCLSPECQEIYNVKSNPPTTDDKCKKCGSPVMQRDDETEEAIIRRLSTYTQKTSPLIGFYQREGILKNFVSLDSKETVGKIREALNKDR